MNISKASWHYRFNDRVRPLPLDSRVFTTCSYIRFTLWNMLGMLIAGLLTLTMAGWILTVVGSAIALPFVYLLGLEIPTFVGFFGVVGWLILGVALVSIFVEYLMEKYKEKRKEKELGLLLQAAEDRKKGVCTLVEFV